MKAIHIHDRYTHSRLKENEWDDKLNLNSLKLTLRWYYDPGQTLSVQQEYLKCSSNQGIYFQESQCM